jgi:predicted DNA-binding protein (UPF0278 family)
VKFELELETIYVNNIREIYPRVCKCNINALGINVWPSYRRTLSNILQQHQCSNQIVQEVAGRASMETPEEVEAKDLPVDGVSLYVLYPRKKMRKELRMSENCEYEVQKSVVRSAVMD